MTPDPSPASEPVEVLDAEGRVVGNVTRAEMRRRNLPHRAVYVLVVDGADRLLVHRRADWKDVWPSRWDVAFGGVAGIGEAPIENARRELAEEAGIEAPLRRLGHGSYEDGEVRVRGDVFLVRHEGPFTFPDGEVVATDWVPLEGIRRWLEDRPVCPDSVSIALPLLPGASGASG